MSVLIMPCPSGPYTMEDISYEYAPLRIAPLVYQITGKPKSVGDWGSNAGYWLDRFRKLGVEKVKGFDRCARIEEGLLNDEEFEQVDFEDQIPAWKCDLAICLENAEHVSPERAPVLLDTLAESAPIVFFSAAVPGQGGSDHINEQPHSYWHYEFGIRGFAYFDLIRWAISDDYRIFQWYRNNSFLYSRIPLPYQPTDP